MPSRKLHVNPYSPTPFPHTSARHTSSYHANQLFIHKTGGLEKRSAFPPALCKNIRFSEYPSPPLKVLSEPRGPHQRGDASRQASCTSTISSKGSRLRSILFIEGRIEFARSDDCRTICGLRLDTLGVSHHDTVTQSVCIGIPRNSWPSVIPGRGVKEKKNKKKKNEFISPRPKS